MAGITMNHPQTYFVPRSCEEYDHEDVDSQIKPIEDYRKVDRYVLLGEPGSGKTTVFKKEADAIIDGCYETASDFIHLDKLAEWQGKTLFIDGLDETRAGSHDVRTPLDAIRAKLHHLKVERYRISCREADWYGTRDEVKLTSASGNIKVLKLLPLTQENIVNIIHHDTRIANTEVFLSKSNEYSLTNLLENPQTLNMLIEATKGGSVWPNTKQEVYQLACQQLVQESNDEHLIANEGHAFNSDHLLDAAGFLYAIQLISSVNEFSIVDKVETESISLKRLNLSANDAHYQVLKSRLFTHISHEKYGSVHRSIGEFLAARYIASQLRKGLSLRRCFTLLTGYDGGVVAALRGLLAWICSLSSKARSEVIGIDPLGVVLYGDAQAFTIAEKKQLIEALRSLAKKTGYLNYNDGKQFSAITTSDMVPYINEIFSVQSYAIGDQEVIICILYGLASGAPKIDLKKSLINIIRDENYIKAARLLALDVLKKYEDYAQLLEIANALKNGQIKDETDELLGSILIVLYPTYISAHQIFDYLKVSLGKNGAHNYLYFWDYHLSKTAKDADVPILLDDLASRDSKILRYDQHHTLHKMSGELLLRGLQVYGESIEARRLYRWLGIGKSEDRDDYLSEDVTPLIREWITSHPEKYLAVLEVGIEQKRDEAHFYLASQNLWGATPPANIGPWWLTQALKQTQKSIKGNCFKEAFFSLKDMPSDAFLSLEHFEEWVLHHSEFNELYQSLIYCTPGGWQSEHVLSRKKWKADYEEEIKARLNYFQQHKAAIADGTAAAGVLYHLASAYYEHYSNVEGKTGLDRLKSFLNDDESLIQAAISGIPKTLYRDDLPSTSEIFKLAVKQRQHYIRLPFLTAMAEGFAKSPEFLSSLSDELSEKALAFWYTYGAGNEPLWVKQLCLSKPHLASKVIIEYTEAMLKGKMGFIYGHYQIARDPDYKEIAKLVALPLLKKYPAKSSVEQASCLESLLKAALQYENSSVLLAIINEKLKRKSLDTIQHVYWLAAGLLIRPEEFEDRVTEFVSQMPERINHLSDFLYPGWRSNESTFDLKLSSMELLVKLLGPRSNPSWPEGGGIVTKSMNEGDYVNSLIKKISENPSEESGEIIKRLLLLPELSEWNQVLLSAQQTQIVSRREASFKHPNIMETASALRSSLPISVADLAAITMDLLDATQKEMHSTNTDNYKRFWNEDQYGRATNPKSENSCRNYLAEKINSQLSKLDIVVDPECLAANSKRADMRIMYSSNNKCLKLPIEIKRNFHDELWTAIHKQLIPLYTKEPNTDGHGIYLVLWFGSDFAPKKPPIDGGKKPQTPEELRFRLTSTMTSSEQKLIEVVVLDVSKPH